ncbi:MAG: spherulation-specific family 4 protein [Nitrososphaerota archaeon]
MEFSKPSIAIVLSFLLFIYSYVFIFNTIDYRTFLNYLKPSIAIYARSDHDIKPAKGTDHTENERTGIYVPLYSYPTLPEWSEVVRIKELFPMVPFLTCINPSNGPGSGFEPAFATGIDSLNKAGILVGGYLATNYGHKPQSQVKEEISKYKMWYDKVNGICFDEMQSKPGKEKYYESMTRFSKSLGFNFTVGNPGTDVSPTYVGKVDYMKIYEGSGIPALSSLKGWHMKYNKKNFMTIAYDVPYVNYTYLADVTKYLGFLYITDDILPNPYDTLPNYLMNITRFLNSTYGY